MARILLAALVALVATPALAHHGWSEYDGTKELARNGRPDMVWADSAIPAARPAAPDSARGGLEQWL